MTKTHLGQWEIWAGNRRAYSCSRHLAKTITLIRINQHSAVSVWQNSKRSPCYVTETLLDDEIRHHLRRAAEFVNPRDGLNNIRRAIGDV